MLRQDVRGFLQILQRGAIANAVLYTLVEPAKANDLDVYEYLKYLLEEIPNMDFNNHPEILVQFLYWLTDLPEACKLNHKRIKSTSHNDIPSLSE